MRVMMIINAAITVTPKDIIFSELTILLRR